MFVVRKYELLKNKLAPKLFDRLTDIHKVYRGEYRTGIPYVSRFDYKLSVNGGKRDRLK